MTTPTPPARTTPTPRQIRLDIARGLKRAYGPLGVLLAGVAQLVTSAQLEAAITWVQEAGAKFPDPLNRRPWVTTRVQESTGLPPHLAGLLTELAVTWDRHQDDVAVQQGDEEEGPEEPDDTPEDPDAPVQLPLPFPEPEVLPDEEVAPHKAPHETRRARPKPIRAAIKAAVGRKK